MTHEQLLEHSSRVRTLVLGAEKGATTPKVQRRPAAFDKRTARGRRRWLDEAALELARTPLVFGEG
jgi:hypothetical protein